MLFLADLKQATFLGTSWSAPYQVVSIPEFQPMVDNSAGTCGIAVAPNSHLGIVTGEYGGNQIGVIKLPDKSGNAAGTPTILDYAAAFLPNTPDGLAWQMGLDPHTVTAYTSPTNRKQYAIIEDDAYVGLDYSKHGTRTYLAVVDLQALLALPRADPTHNVRDPLVTCQGAGVNGTPPVPNCVVRFVGSNP
jgi:hypothetical protein